MKSIKIIVETPGGSAQKYDYDAKNARFELKKILPSGMVFPYDFGFIPGTKGEDGDPLDIILISEFHSFPGCVIESRVIGCMRAEQSAAADKPEMIRNDRYIAIPCCSRFFEPVKDISDLDSAIVKELENFFINYNKLEGKKFHVEKTIGAEKAVKSISKNV